MQISPIKNQNFEKPSRNPSNRTKVKILKKQIFRYLSKKIWFRVCSVTAEIFEHRNSGENRGKEANFFLKIYEGHIRIWFRSKYKIISCLCTFNVPPPPPVHSNSFLIILQYTITSFNMNHRKQLAAIVLPFSNCILRILFLDRRMLCTENTHQN